VPWPGGLERARIRDEWVELGVFEKLELIVLEACDRITGLALADIPVDG
jgi:hypothetical protein